MKGKEPDHFKDLIDEEMNWALQGKSEQSLRLRLEAELNQKPLDPPLRPVLYKSAAVAAGIVFIAGLFYLGWILFRDPAPSPGFIDSLVMLAPENFSVPAREGMNSPRERTPFPGIHPVISEEEGFAGLIRRIKPEPAAKVGVSQIGEESYQRLYTLNRLAAVLLGEKAVHRVLDRILNPSKENDHEIKDLSYDHFRLVFFGFNWC